MAPRIAVPEPDLDRTGHDRGAPAEAAPDADMHALPLSPEQREHWVAWRFDAADAPSRVACWVLSFPAPVERTRLERAVGAVRRRHAALRCVVLPDGSGQRIVPHPGNGDESLTLATWGEDPESRRQVIADAIDRRLESGIEPPVAFWWSPRSDGTGELTFAAHPVVVDTGAGRRVMEEIAASYHPDSEQFDGGAAAFLQEEAEDRREAEAARAAEAVAYWRAKLAAPPAALDLPADATRPAAPSGRGGRTRRAWPSGLVRTCEALAQRLGCSFKELVIAAWAAVLHRLSGSEAFLLEYRVDRPGVSVGVSMALRPLHVACDGGTSFKALVAAVARERAEVVRHAGADLAEIVREFSRPRDPARPWMSGVAIACEMETVGSTLPEGVTLRHEPSEHLDGDLSLTVSRAGAEVALEAHFNSEVFRADTVHRWLGHVASVLESAGTDPDQPVDRLALLTREERDAIIGAPTSASRPDLPHVALLHRAFEASAARRPDHPAVATDADRVTFAELDRRANQLAHHLLALGAAPERCVALVLDRSVDYAIATLGVLKSGAAFVPIDPEWPAERQDLVVRDCDAFAVITAGRPIPGDLPGHVAVVHLRQQAPILESRPTSTPQAAARPEHLAYLIYTSGSTGQPKGVMIEHRAAAVHMASITEVYQLRPDDCSLLFHSVAFDPAIEQLFAPWVAGGTVFIRGSGLWTGREFSAWVRRERITAVTLPPLYWLQLLRDWEQEPGLAPVGQLRRVLVGGEALPPAVVDLWRRLGLTSIRLLNGYGPTECTVTATVHDVPAEPSIGEATGRIPIGRPQGPVQAYVLDAHLQPQPVGVPGELCLGGPTVARGYLHRDTLTHERFLPHPFGSPGRIYRTGDTARLLADGTIDFCGRADRQVKVGGYRVEPGEIEAVLGRCANVSACAVVVETEPSGASSLIGYVVSAPAAAFSEAALRAAVAESLPRYMVPARIFPIDELPRTINGKLDTAALGRHGAGLRRAEAEAEASAGSVVPPVQRDPLEAEVAQAWSELLGRPDVRSADDFFLSGGHSLLAVGLFARLERRFQVQLALSDWLADASFGALVGLVRQAVAGTAPSRSAAGRRFLFPIHEGGSRPRLFLFAGGRGCDEDFVVLAALTRALGPDQPVWGLRLGGPDRLAATHTSAVAMAADVAREIREFQPSGPYHIAGECIGGLLAYAVAQILVREGEAVAFLGMINTGCPRFAEPFRWWVSTSWIGRARQTAGPLLGILRRSPLREAPTHLREAFVRVVRPPHSGRAARADGMPEDPKDYFYGHLLLRYKPEPGAIPLTLFGCETYKRVNNVRRWSRHTRVRLVPIQGNSTTCIREYAVDSAARLNAELAKATAGAGT